MVWFDMESENSSYLSDLLIAIEIYSILTCTVSLFSRQDQQHMHKNKTKNMCITTE